MAFNVLHQLRIDVDWKLYVGNMIGQYRGCLLVAASNGGVSVVLFTEASFLFDAIYIYMLCQLY